MRHFLPILTFVVLCLFKGNSQIKTLSQCPVVKVRVKLAKDTFKVGSDIRLTMTLTNNSGSVQSVWFDRPKSSTGGPAWTSVILANKTTGKSVLKYQNKATLQSQAYSTDQVKKFSYQLKPGQKVFGQFSLYDLVVVKNNKDTLEKGNYEIELFYCSNSSGKVSFTVD
jgi:hypothetical protein